MEDKKVCFCKQVNYSDIKEAISKGATNVDDVKKSTGAGSACGRCCSSIEEIVKSEQK